MYNSDDHSAQKQVDSPATTTPTPTAPPTDDLENQNQNPNTNQNQNQTAGTGFGVGRIVRRWKREDLLKRACLALRGMALLFSVLSFIITVSNKHGDWKDFDKYEEYRYLLAISILSTLYAGGQALKQVQELSTGTLNFSQKNTALIDFFGDQIVAYLLISSLSAAVPLTNRMREGSDNTFTDSSAAAISMSFFAFVALALSAIIAGYKLSHQSYI